jgi:hypothetical protein
MNFKFLKIPNVRLHFILAILFALLIVVGGIFSYDAVSSSIKQQDYALILVILIILETFANSWRIAVAIQNSKTEQDNEVLEEPAFSPEEQEFAETEQKIKLMVRGNKNMEE